MKSFYPDPRWKWFWRTHLLVAVGVVVVTLIVDAFLAIGLFFVPELSPQSDPTQLGNFRREMTGALIWQIPADLILIPLTIAQYGFCAQRKHFTRSVAVTAFFIAILYVGFRLLISPSVPGSRATFMVTLFLVFELIVMWLYVYQSPHLWKSGILANS